MPFNKNRNSRDDKSGKGPKKPNRSEAPGKSKSEQSFKSSSSSFSRRDDANSSRDKKPYGSREGSSFGDKKPYGSREGSAYGDKKPYGTRGDNTSRDKKMPYGTRSEGSFQERKAYGDRKEGATNKKSFSERRENTGEKKPFGQRGESGAYERKPYGDKKENSRERKPFSNRAVNNEETRGNRSENFSRPYKKRAEREENQDVHKTEFDDSQVKLRSRSSSPKSAPKKEAELIRLNRFISNAGICSRRKADELIEAGVITVNGAAVSELGAKINPLTDEVRYNGTLLKREKMVYVLLNKPKDYITTTDDPQERKTVMELVDKASRERIYPVGRLDRNTTGLLLMTNDGELADRLSHPKNSVSKIYHVELNKNLSQGDFNKIAFGLELEDGLIKPDEVRYIAGGGKNEVGIQIHSGKNRIVRRIFESLGYEVVKLDRVIYANLTKKDLPRGRWRYLTEHEVIQLKHFVK
ncbi:rRNA pseudouridine synthase [Pelobium sp.]|nr:pseudouridine synthase [Pelobium sp.]MDA9555582.1 rRNA pseudouridine synthase [Pelobium sp.]